MAYVSIYQHTRHDPSGYCTSYTLLAFYRKGGGVLKEDGIFRVREIFARKEDIYGSKVLKEGRKEDDEGSKYLGKEVLVWKAGRYLGK